jgi:hypothetical protein
VIPVRKDLKVIQALLVQLDLRAKKLKRALLARKVLPVLPVLLDRKAQLVLLVQRDQLVLREVLVLAAARGLFLKMQMEFLLTMSSV